MRIFEPAVGVGDSNAVLSVGDIGSADVRIDDIAVQRANGGDVDHNGSIQVGGRGGGRRDKSKEKMRKRRSSSMIFSGG